MGGPAPAWLPRASKPTRPPPSCSGHTLFSPGPTLPGALPSLKGSGFGFPPPRGEKPPEHQPKHRQI